MAWFKKTRRPMASQTAEKPSRVPEGLWVKCPDCGQPVYKPDLESNLSVCPKCAHHFRMTRRRGSRRSSTAARYTEHYTNLRSNDPLEFTDTKPYRDRL